MYFALLVLWKSRGWDNHKLPWDRKKYLVLTSLQSSPYIFTRMNSNLSGSGDEPSTAISTTEEQTTRASPTKEQSTATTTANLITCEDQPCTQHVPEWVVAALCVMAISVVMQTVVISLYSTKKSRKSNQMVYDDKNEKIYHEKYDSTRSSL